LPCEGRGVTTPGQRISFQPDTLVLLPLSPPSRGEGCPAPARGDAVEASHSGKLGRRPGAGRGEGPRLRAARVPMHARFRPCHRPVAEAATAPLDLAPMFEDQRNGRRAGSEAIRAEAAFL